ncbi:MAG: hypothetical protein CFH21_00583 [Alphaproteobacteria bacterium MarineAlpha5_Bin11]|nr:ABC transporter permease [Pelagibacteraceae bacterium]PPR43983.1 MAG: hypothetical protein CFH21_00583 [Alphaproteobacteria bacterium MarineAlpha5_Bin11]PPR51266.1 MAG: hypothetical protein CFH20_00692 [Alphaproteobacteria bacterium MarineAlpha5_Bin10]|tara:strand:+ start:9785 stop:10645 length:861 start_codon:yes stop_codon:yes gene_type:complete
MKIKENKIESWDLVIKSKSGWFNLNLKEIYLYRDLIYLLIKRDFTTFYKQTILGPLWYVIQPLVNTLVFTVIFGKVAQISTDGTPPFIFYMAGTVAWGYFATCLTLTSNTFVTNASIFGRVYFPRITVPISQVVISLFQFLIQFIIFLCFLFYFLFKGADIQLNNLVLILPLILLQMAILGLGVGILISSLTAKYRDLTFAMTFGVQLWMFATPVVYPLSIVPQEYRMLAALNPMTSIIELFRKSFLGTSSIEIVHIIISIIITVILFVIGLILFSRIEKDFMDTV